MAILPDKIVKLREFMALRKKKKKDEPPPEGEGAPDTPGEETDAEGTKGIPSKAKLFLASTLIPMVMAYVIFSNSEDVYWNESTIEFRPDIGLSAKVLDDKLTTAGIMDAVSIRLDLEGSLAGKGASKIKDSVDSLDVTATSSVAKGMRGVLVRVKSTEEAASAQWVSALVDEFNARNHREPTAQPSAEELQARSLTQEIQLQIDKTMQERQAAVNLLRSQGNQPLQLGPQQEVVAFYDELFKKADATVTAIRNEPFSISDRMLIIYSFYKGNQLQKDSPSGDPDAAQTPHRNYFVQQERFPEYGEGIFKKFFQEAKVLEVAGKRYNEILGALGTDAPETTKAKEYWDGKDTMVKNIHEEALMSLLRDHNYLQEGLTTATNALDNASQQQARSEQAMQSISGLEAKIERLVEAKSSLEASIAKTEPKLTEFPPPLKITGSTSGSESQDTPLTILAILTGGAGFAGFLFALIVSILQGKDPKTDNKDEEEPEGQPVEIPDVIEMPPRAEKKDPAEGKDVIEAETLEEATVEEETPNPLDWEYEDEEPYAPDPGE